MYKKGLLVVFGALLLSGCMGEDMALLGKGNVAELGNVVKEDDGFDVDIHRAGYVDGGSAEFEELWESSYEYYIVLDMEWKNETGSRLHVDRVGVEQEGVTVSNVIDVGDGEVGNEGNGENRGSVDRYRFMDMGEVLLDGESRRGVVVLGMVDAKENGLDEDGEEITELVHELDRFGEKELFVNYGGERISWSVSEGEESWDGDYIESEGVWEDRVSYESVDYAGFGEGDVAYIKGDGEISDVGDVRISVREAVYFDDVSEDLLSEFVFVRGITGVEEALIVNVEIENQSDEDIELNRFMLRKGVNYFGNVEDSEAVSMLNVGVNGDDIRSEIMHKYSLVPFYGVGDGKLSSGGVVEGNVLFLSQRFEEGFSYYISYSKDSGVVDESDEDGIVDVETDEVSGEVIINFP